MVKKIWRFEVWRVKIEILESFGGLFENIECWEGFCVKR
jgi:hypothetical protein